MKKLITITTDFGDAFAAAQLKAVAASFDFDGQTIENHSVKKFSIVEGAFQILTLAEYCPKNTVHVGVVDPGVGSERRGIVIQTKNGYFVGPDNGLLYPAANKDGVTKIWKINEKYFNKIAATFHGRDIFIKCGVFLAQGRTPTEFGCKQIHKIRKLEFKNGQVLHIDDYGNIKIFWKEPIKAGRNFMLKRNNRKTHLPVVKTFSDVNAGSELMYLGSSDTLELAICQDSAAYKFGIQNEEVLNLYEQS